MRCRYQTNVRSIRSDNLNHNKLEHVEVLLKNFNDIPNLEQLKNYQIWTLCFSHFKVKEDLNIILAILEAHFLNELTDLMISLGNVNPVDYLEGHKKSASAAFNLEAINPNIFVECWTFN